jgi:hypothetical protein
MSLRKWTRLVGSHKTALFASLVVIGAIAVYNWIVAPHRNYLLAAQRYESIVTALEKKNQIISNNLKIKKLELKELEDKFKHVQAIAFNPLEARAFFSSIKAVCEEVGCKMHSLTFSSANFASVADNPEINSYITTSKAQLIVLGGYGNIVALINKLQGGAQYVRIDSLKVNSDNQNPGYLRCDMDVTIYVINEKKDQKYD